MSSAPPTTPLPPQVFRQAVEQAALAISITDGKARILYANPAFQRATGYKAEELAGENQSMLSYKMTPKIVYETLWAQLKRQRAWNGLLVNRRKDGSRYLADLTITPVLDEMGNTTHYLGMHRDVTEMHHLERQVHNQKHLIESVVDAAQVAIALLDDSERVVLDNQEYKKLIGDLGREPAQTLLAALRENLGPEFAKAGASGRGFAGHELRFDRPGREPRWFSCAGSWIEELDSSADAFYAPTMRKYLLLVVQDVTAIKANEETIRVNGLRALLAEQERIQSLREALSGAIYQLEGPLNMVAAASRMLERRPDAEQPDFLAAVLHEAMDKGQEVLATLRGCVPDETREAPQSVNLNALLQDVLRLHTPRLLADGVVVEWQPAAALPNLNGRPTQLYSLFKQLVENALDAIHESRGERRELRLTTLAVDDRLEVLIEDSGPGVPEEWRLKVFEPYFTTKGAQQQHIGMGLAMAQDIVMHHGGLINLEPGPGGGCRVRVQFPAV